MDLEENIRIAFEVYWKNLPVTTELNTGTHSDAFIAGAKSQAAKDFWYNEFKRQKIQSDSGQDQSLRNKPMKPSECFHGKSTLEENYTTVQKDGNRRVTIVIPDLTKLDGVSEEYERAKQYQEYIDEHPDRPISFDNWKYMVEHYEKPELLSEQDIDDVVSKRIGIIGHVDHGKSIKCAIVGVGSQMIIPEPIISKQELLLMNDEAMKHSIAEEKFKNNHAWDIKKEKTVSHKRNNKRK